MPEPTIEEEIAAVSDALVHAHGSLHIVMPRVGLTMAADGVRHELNAIGDDLMELHQRLDAVLEQIRARTDS